MGNISLATASRRMCAGSGRNDLSASTVHVDQSGTQVNRTNDRGVAQGGTETFPNPWEVSRTIPDSAAQGDEEGKGGGECRRRHCEARARQAFRRDSVERPKQVGRVILLVPQIYTSP